MASRLFAAAATAATSSPLPLARRITSRGVPGPQGRRWYSEKMNVWEKTGPRRWEMVDSSGERMILREKVNLWEAPTSPMNWKNSHFVAATFTVWGVCVFSWFKFFDGEKNKKAEVDS